MEEILYNNSSCRPYGDIHDDNDDFENSLLENESKYKYARNISYDGKGIYIYRGVILEVHNIVTYLHYNNTENYMRNVHNEYLLTIKDNTFTHEQLTILFTNIEYIINVIKKRIIRIFDKNYDGLEDSFEAIYNKDNKTFKLVLEYEIMEQFAVDYKNIMITEIIIGTILDAIEELKEVNEIEALQIVTNDISK